jgi:hypothetical protein
MENKELETAVASIIEKNDRNALAELIVEYTQPNHLADVYMSRILNTRTLKPGDALVRKTRKGIVVRTLVPGSVHLANEITQSERINYVLDGADVKVNYSEWDIENGDIGTVSEIRSEMAKKLNDFYINKGFTALSTVWTAANTPSNFISLGTSITATALQNAINYINSITPGVKAVIGSRAAMTPITNFAGFYTDGSTTVGSQSIADEVLKTGKVGTYYGAPLISVDQIYDNPEDYKAMLPVDKILVIGENVGEFITYGEPRWKQWSDMNPTPPMWNIEVYQQFGMLVDFAEGIYIIKVV